MANSASVLAVGIKLYKTDMGRSYEKSYPRFFGVFPVVSKKLPLGVWLVKSRMGPKKKTCDLQAFWNRIVFGVPLPEPFRYSWLTSVEVFSNQN